MPAFEAPQGPVPAEYNRVSRPVHQSKSPGWLNETLVRLMPLVPRAVVRPMALRYVAGESLASMVRTVQQLNREGAMATIDVLGEFIHAFSEAEKTAEDYHAVLKAIASEGLDANISIKLSAFGLTLDEAACLGLVKPLVASAEAQQTFVRIDMEDTACTDATFRVYEALAQAHGNTGVVVQAYLRRTHDDVLRLMATGHKHFRLCKGIYREPRWHAYTHPELVNRNYEAILDAMLAQGAYVGIATHDERLVWAALKLIRKYQLPPEAYEFQMLYGVDRALRDMLIAAGHRVRIYVPFGPQWYAYSLRRFRENPTIAGYVLQSLLVRV